MIGRTVSHYEVLEEISRGGMGVVYRAHDTRLGRDVALKVLPPELVADPERRQRFVQEARAASVLEHPHIAVIHEIDEADGVSFIAMELVRGEKLSDVLARGALPVGRALEIASEVADGPYSVILEQVANGVAVRMAVLYLMAGGVEDEAAA